MGNAISSAVTDSWRASHERRVKKWLDDATEDSVLDALTASFFQGGQGYGGLPAARDARSHIKETFGAYGYIDHIDKKRYWVERDLELFLSNRFPGSELSASIPILWRCFHFHAFFPFPHEPKRINYSAFHRTIGFLAAGGNLRLGENAAGITLLADRYPDDSGRQRKRLWILFRSLSNRSPTASGRKSVETDVEDLSNTEQDLMEALALTQPDDACIMPAPIEELRPHAKRIMSSITRYTYSSIPRGEFLSLLKLCLSVQLDKPEWGTHEPYFFTGRALTPPDPDILQGAADAILRKSTSGEKSDVDWHSFQNVLSVYLPDLATQFRLIFTSFLFPLTATNQTLDIPTPNPTIPVPYAQYLNLFLHPPLAGSRRYVFEDFARQQGHYALQTTQAAYSASPPSINTTDLITALRPIKTGTLLLITGEAIAPDTHASSRVTIGACMPTAWDLDRERSFRASPSQELHRFTTTHMLFQLEPRHEIFRPESDAWIMDLIHIINDDTEIGRKGGLRFGAEGGSGLCVDFDSGIATLRNVTTSEDGANQDKESGNVPPTPTSSYHAIAPPADRGHPAGNWSSSLSIQKFELYDLGGHATAPFQEQLDEKARLPKPPPVPYPIQTFAKDADRPTTEKPSAPPQVSEEELRKRIQGFGPSV